MTAGQARVDRLEELLATRAVEGLDTAETLELEALLAEFEGVDPVRFDEAAAFVWLAGWSAAAEEPLPESVAARVRAQLASGDGEPPARSEPRGSTPRYSSGETATAQPGAAGTSPRPPRRPGPQWGWAAAAAALVLALAGWWPQLFDRPVDEPVALADARDRLVEEAPDAVELEWQASDDPLAEGVSGHVVWSESAQRGYLTFRNIPDNDPSEQQYQLWVFDDERDERYPVDGGVFDAPADYEDEVVIPIRSQLPIHSAEMFAVTLEEPGGAVVSERDRILWVAERDDAAESLDDEGI